MKTKPGFAVSGLFVAPLASTLRKISLGLVGFLNFFLLFLSTGNVFAQGFDAFLARVNSAPVSLRPAIVDSFMAVVPSFPFTENDTTVQFIYRGAASSATIPGDANYWSTLAFPMTNISGTDFWYYSSKFESDARLDYKFIIDGSTWILDPRNPNQVIGGYGPNSELKMPRYP